MNLENLAHLGLDLRSMKVPILVSSIHRFSSSKCVIGRLLFVLVFHVGLFVFAFFSKSRFRGSSFPRSRTFVPKHVYKLAI